MKTKNNVQKIKFMSFVLAMLVALMGCGVTRGAEEEEVSGGAEAVEPGDGWQIVEGDGVTFQVPVDWIIVEEEPGQGSVINQWRLGIPGVDGEQRVAFFELPFDQMQPPDVLSEYPFEIGGRPGTKWVRAGEGYVSYAYYTSADGEAGSFGIHVTVAEQEPELETVLDQVAMTVVFQ